MSTETYSRHWDVYSVNYTCDAHVPDNILSGNIVFFSKVYFDPIIAIPPPCVSSGLVIIVFQTMEWSRLLDC